MDEKGLSSVSELTGQSVKRYSNWGDLNLNHQIVAEINNDVCINCNKCHIACEDTAHQCIDMLKDEDGNPILRVREEECVGCNLCSIVCPVDGAINMVEKLNDRPPMSWNERERVITSLTASKSS